MLSIFTIRRGGRMVMRQPAKLTHVGSIPSLVSRTMRTASRWLSWRKPVCNLLFAPTPRPTDFGLGVASLEHIGSTPIRGAKLCGVRIAAIASAFQADITMGSSPIPRSNYFSESSFLRMSRAASRMRVSPRAATSTAIMSESPSYQTSCLPLKSS